MYKMFEVHVPSSYDVELSCFVLCLFLQLCKLFRGKTATSVNPMDNVANVLVRVKMKLVLLLEFPDLLLSLFNYMVVFHYFCITIIFFALFNYLHVYIVFFLSIMLQQ